LDLRALFDTILSTEIFLKGWKSYTVHCVSEDVSLCKHYTCFARHTASRWWNC